MIEGISEREKTILELLAREPAVSVSRIGEVTGVSTVTVRADLASLEAQGLIIRTRGGASPAFHPEIMARLRRRTDQKNRIARAAAALVESGDTIMIEAGTTTALVARYLIGKRNVRIVTNSALVIPYARVNPGVHLSLLGGTFLPETEATVGPVALAELDSFHVRKAFVGTDGFTVENGLSSHFPEAAAVLGKMVERSEQTILVADSSKYGKKGFVSIVPLTAVERLITDSEIGEPALAELREAGLDVEVV